MAVCYSRAYGFSLDLDVQAILCVDESLVTAVQGCVGQGMKVNVEAKLVVREIFG